MTKVLWGSKRWYLSLLWEPRDCWVGVYWTRVQGEHSRLTSVYVTLIPMLPLEIEFVEIF